jgi:hypothetical protein
MSSIFTGPNIDRLFTQGRQLSTFMGWCVCSPTRAIKGGKPGTYKVYLDNLRLRHADGSTTPIWTNGKDTRFRKIADSELFTHISVRAIPISGVEK